MHASSIRSLLVLAALLIDLLMNRGPFCQCQSSSEAMSALLLSDEARSSSQLDQAHCFFQQRVKTPCYKSMSCEDTRDPHTQRSYHLSSWRIAGDLHQPASQPIDRGKVLFFSFLFYSFSLFSKVVKKERKKKESLTTHNYDRYYYFDFNLIFNLIFNLNLNFIEDFSSSINRMRICTRETKQWINIE